jgi:hypothetical protein
MGATEQGMDGVVERMTERIMKLQGIVLRNGKRSGLLMARRTFLQRGDDGAVRVIDSLLEPLGPFESPDW